MTSQKRRMATPLSQLARFANLVILAAIAYLVLLVAYALGIRLSLSDGYLAYLPLTIMLIALVGSLRLPEAQRIKLALLLISTGGTLYAIEAGMMLSDSGIDERRVAAAKKANLPYDTRSRRDVIERLKGQGLDAVPDVGSTYFVGSDYRMEVDGRGILPLGGISNAATVLCNDSGVWVAYDSDEHGFHNPNGLYDLDQLGIAAVGDSFTQGVCVPSEQNAVALIREIYPHTLNVGVGGNGPLSMLASLKEYAAPLKPRIVLWFHFEGNDLWDLSRERTSDILLRYLEADYSQGLLALQPDVDREIQDFIGTAMTEPVGGDPFLGFLVLRRLRRTAGLSGPYSRLDPLFRRTMAAATEVAASWNGRLYFVYLPQAERFIRADRASPHRDEVLRVVEELEIPVVDIVEAFVAAEDPLSLFPFRLPGHYNEEGYGVVAEAVLQFVEAGARVSAEQ